MMKCVQCDTDIKDLEDAALHMSNTGHQFFASEAVFDDLKQLATTIEQYQQKVVNAKLN